MKNKNHVKPLNREELAYTLKGLSPNGKPVFDIEAYRVGSPLVDTRNNEYFGWKDFADWEGTIFSYAPEPRLSTKEALFRMTKYQDGVMLLPAQTQSRMWQRSIWDFGASNPEVPMAILFLRNSPDDPEGNFPCDPYALVAYGQNAVDILENCTLPGALITEWAA